MPDLTRGANAPLHSTSLTISVSGARQGSVDLMAFQLGTGRKVRSDDDFIFFNQPRSPEGAVVLAGADRLTVDLTRIPASVETIAVAVALDDVVTGSLSSIAGLAVTVSGGADTQTAPADGLSSERAAVLVEVYRRAGAWKLRNVSAGWVEGLAALAREHGVSVDDEPAPTAAAAPVGRPATASPPAAPSPAVPPAAPSPAVPPAAPPRPSSGTPIPTPFPSAADLAAGGRPQAPVVIAPTPFPSAAELAGTHPLAAPPARAAAAAPAPAAPYRPPAAAPAAPAASAAAPAPAAAGPRSVPGEARLSLAKREKLDLRKREVHKVLLTKNAAQERARIVLVLDKTGSMYDEYQAGIVHRVVERMVPVAIQLDDDGSLECYLYAVSFAKLPDLRVEQLDEWMAEFIHIGGVHGGIDYQRIGGYNDEIPIMDEIIRTLPGQTQPTLVLFFTDGGFTKKREITKLMQKASNLPAFWQFVGIGNNNFGVLTKLDEMGGRVVDNVGFFAVTDIDRIDDAELYRRLLQEFPDWLRTARDFDIIR